MADGKQLRFGILATGNIAGQFCNGVRAARRCVLAAVGSRSETSAKAFADKYGISSAYGSYDALLADDRVDAIYNSLPNSMHHEWTIKALRAGKHVLCEKPMAVTVAEAEEMFAEARRAKRVLVEAFMYVSHPQTAQIVRAVQDGVVGQLQLIRTSFSFRTKRVEGNIRFQPTLAGGALMDVGCYCVSFARLFAKSDVTDVHAVAKLHPSGVDELTGGTMRFANGIVSTFNCGMTTQCDNTAHLCGTEGYIAIPWPWKPPATGATYTIAHNVPPKQDQPAGIAAPPPKQTITVDAHAELYALEADDFAAAVFDGAALKIAPEDTIANTHVLQQIRSRIGLGY
jgi:xylose dehydrogenase (NAD/NADP)